MLFIRNWNVRHHQPTFNLAPSRPKSLNLLVRYRSSVFPAPTSLEAGDAGAGPDLLHWLLLGGFIHRLRRSLWQHPTSNSEEFLDSLCLCIRHNRRVSHWSLNFSPKGEHFCDGVEIEVVVTCHHNPKVQWDDLHASRNRRRESKGQWQGLQLQNLLWAVDEWWWQVTCDETRLLDQGQRSTQGWLLKICAQHFSGAPTSFWDGAW